MRPFPVGGSSLDAVKDRRTAGGIRIPDDSIVKKGKRNNSQQSEDMFISFSPFRANRWFPFAQLPQNPKTPKV